MRETKTKSVVMLMWPLVVLFSQNSWSQEELYTQVGKDPAWETILAEKKIPIGVNSTKGITGSTIDVNNDLFKRLTYGSHPIEEAISIHTPGNSTIPREDFPKWSRWYQEDGNTQVFRMFKGERNVRGTRPRTPAGRIESFGHHWKKGDGWQEWVGTYTIVKTEGCVGPHYCSIFQIKNPINDWPVMIRLKSNGDIVVTNNRRARPEKLIARNMKGKSFDLRVRDDGHNYEVYFNEKLVNQGSFARPKDTTSFRWGLYFGKSIPAAETMIFVTGATFRSQKKAVDPQTKMD